MKFCKKPVIIEAVQLRWDTWSEMCEHAGVGKLTDGKPEGCGVSAEGQPLLGQTTDEIGLVIPTPEGVMLARQNDWVIRGVKGELYPCKPDIFEATYGAVAVVSRAGGDAASHKAVAEVFGLILCPYCWPHDVGFLDRGTLMYDCSHCGTRQTLEQFVDGLHEMAVSHQEELSRLHTILNGLMPFGGRSVW